MIGFNIIYYNSGLKLLNNNKELKCIKVVRANKDKPPKRRYYQAIMEKKSLENKGFLKKFFKKFLPNYFLRNSLDTTCYNVLKIFLFRTSE